VCLLVWLSSQVRPAVDRAVAWYRGPGPSPVEQLQQEWVDNEITDEEFERRLELALDERAVVIREAVEEIDGVGTERSALLADRFESVEAVRRASRDELTAINDIGPSTAADVQAHFE